MDTPYLEGIISVPTVLAGRMEHSVIHVHISPVLFVPSTPGRRRVGVLINLYLDGDENRLSPRENRFHVFESQFNTSYQSHSTPGCIQGQRAVPRGAQGGYVDPVLSTLCSLFLIL